MAEQRTVDQNFNESYAAKGLQPSFGERPTIKTTRNSSVTYKKFASNDPNFDTNSPDQRRGGIQKDAPRINNNVRSVRIKKEKPGAEDKQYAETEGRSSVINSPLRGRSMGLRNKLALASPTSAAVLDRAKATRTTWVVWGVGIPLWMTFQLPFALLSTLLLGMSLAIQAFFNLGIKNPDDSAIVTFGKDIIAGALKVGSNVGFILSKISDFLFGIDFIYFFNPMTFFMITYVILFAFAIIQLLIIYIFYKLSGLEPLSGKGSGVKNGLFILTLVGYTLPVFNLFPWFLAWTGGIWLKPK